MSGIFISYRRSGSSSVAYRLADELKRAFGEEKIFIDVESIDPGLKFAEAIKNALRQCSIALVVIGPRWISMSNEAGEPRLHDPDDWVRQEVALALKSGMRLIPVLVEGASEPKAEQLPEAIKSLADLQAFSISAAQTHWAFDVGRLIEKMRGIDPGLGARKIEPEPAPANLRYSYKVIAGVAIALLIALTGLVEGWEDGDEITSAVTILGICLFLCIAGYRDIIKGKALGKGGAITGMVFCGLALLGTLGSLATPDDPVSDVPWKGVSAFGSGDVIADTASFVGQWNSPVGSSYQFVQQGNEISFREFNAFGVQVGEGSGELDDNIYYFDYYNQIMGMSTNGSATVNGNAMNVLLADPTTGQNMAYVFYRQ